MGETFNSTQPIYVQIMQRLCRQIVKGELAAGEKLPSVRELAIQTGVNPNTIQHVYTELERMAVVEMRRGQGTFVTDQEARLRQLRDESVSDQIASFLRDMDEMGITPDEILNGLRAHLNQKNSQSKKAE